MLDEILILISIILIVTGAVIIIFGVRQLIRAIKGSNED
jgi:hypothetical protein